VFADDQRLFVSGRPQRVLLSPPFPNTGAEQSMNKMIQTMATVFAIAGLSAIGTANAVTGGRPSTSGMSGLAVDSTDTAQSPGVTAGEGPANSSYGAPGSTGRSTNPFPATTCTTAPCPPRLR
jgi:hypothetical protein